MPSSPDIRLVCFDWGGVVLRICRSFAEGCAAADIPLRPGVDTPEIKAARKVHADEHQLGLIDCDEFYRRASAATRHLYTPDEIRRIHDAWLIAEYPGVDAIVDRLIQTPRLQTALLSNTNHAHWMRHHPRAAGVPGDFPTVHKLQHRYASHIMKLAKPDAAIYETFSRSVGVPPANILFFDDLPDNIATARALGWNAEQIDHTGDTATQITEHLDAYRAW
jgi:putative hydrolase of the HAD superfamily